MYVYIYIYIILTGLCGGVLRHALPRRARIREGILYLIICTVYSDIIITVMQTILCIILISGCYAYLTYDQI